MTPDKLLAITDAVIPIASALVIISLIIRYRLTQGAKQRNNVPLFLAIPWLYLGLLVVFLGIANTPFIERILWVRVAIGILGGLITFHNILETWRLRKRG